LLISRVEKLWPQATLALMLRPRAVVDEVKDVGRDVVTAHVRETAVDAVLGAQGLVERVFKLSLFCTVVIGA